MSRVQRIKQGGSAVAFVVVGVILSVGLICTIYFLRQHGEQVRKEQAIALYDQQQADKNAAKTSVASSNSDSDDTDATKSDKSSQSSDFASSELPVTGVELPINELVGIYILTVMIVGYIVSHRSLVRSL